MNPTEVPHDATPFVSDGQVYFLYMGPIEMRNLQRDWGLTRVPGDSPEDWEKKKETFNSRFGVSNMADMITVLRHGLTRWAKAATNGDGPIVLDDDRVAEILQGIQADVPKQGFRKGLKAKRGYALVTELHQRFIFDCMGIGSDDEPEEEAPGTPKEQPQEGSIPSTS